MGEKRRLHQSMEGSMKRRRINPPANLPPFLIRTENEHERRHVIGIFRSLLQTSSNICGMPREILNKDNILELSKHVWWVCEKSAPFWFWWLLTPQKTYFIDHHENVYVIESGRDFITIYSNKAPTLMEGNLTQTTQDVNGKKTPQKWTFLVNDILILKNESFVQLPVSKRLEKIRDDIVLPYRQTEKQIGVPFGVRGKYMIKIQRAKAVLDCMRFSNTAKKFFFRDYKYRENRTEGLMLRREDHNWTHPEGKRCLYVWKYPPTFKATMHAPYIHKNKAKFYLRATTHDGEEDEQLCLESEISRKSAELIKRDLPLALGKAHVECYYNVHNSKYEILQELPTVCEIDTLDDVLQLLQKMIGNVSWDRIREVCHRLELASRANANR